MKEGCISEMLQSEGTGGIFVLGFRVSKNIPETTSTLSSLNLRASTFVERLWNTLIVKAGDA